MAEKRGQRSPLRGGEEDDDEGLLALIAEQPTSKRARVDSTAIVKQVSATWSRTARS